MVLVTWLHKLGRTAGYFSERFELIDYTSPTIIGAAVFLLLAFERLRFTEKPRKIIQIMAPLAFSVYLIHVQPLVWNRVMFQRFSGYALLPTVEMVAAVIGTVVAIYLGCSMIDYVREKLFHVLKLKQMLSTLEDHILGNRD